MKTYEINWSPEEKLYLLTRNGSSEEIGCFKSLPQGIELINSLFKKYIQQKEIKEPLKEYQALFTALGDVLKIFSVDSPAFLSEEVSQQSDPQEFIQKISDMMDSSYEIMVNLTARIRWHSQETPGPFCYKNFLDGIPVICIQFEENGQSFFTNKLFEAETFLKELYDTGNISKEIHEKLIKDARKTFSEISSN